MSYESIHEEQEVEVILEAKQSISSVEPPMSEWSSLEIRIQAENRLKQLYEEGLYDPGSGEVCAAYIPQSDSAVFRHPYYNYPSITDPGILDALLKPPPPVTYPDDGQEQYLALCKTMHQCPVRIFHRGLLESHINLSYYGINPNGVRAMAIAMENNINVTHLNLMDNWLNDDACFHLGKMLERNNNLEDLNLNGCHIGCSGVRRIVEGLLTNRSLKGLNLGRNQLGDDGLEQVARAIFSRSEIRELDLSNNNISGKGCEFLAEAMETQNKFTSVDLSHNVLYSFPSGICAVLGNLAQNPEFEYLNLSWNSLSGNKVASGIKTVFGCKAIRHVELNNNRFCGTTVLTRLTAWFHKPKKMKYFDLSYNPLTLEDALLVITKFEASKIQKLNLEGVSVNQAFTQVMENIRENRKASIIHGYVQGLFKGKPVDPREIVLNRLEYLGKKNKKKQLDIALVIYQYLKDKITSIEVKDIMYSCRKEGVLYDEDLLIMLMDLWPGQPTKKGGRTIGLVALAEYIKRKWPDRKLPPTPPPELAPVPEPKKKDKGKKK